MNKLIIPPINGNNMLEVDLPIYYKVHDDYYALRATSTGKVRTIYLNENTVSFTDSAHLHELTIKDVSNLFLLVKNYVLIQEHLFINQLAKTIQNINS